MKHTIKIIFISLLLLPAFLLRSQDIHFSQFYLTPLLLNPAQAGAQNGIRVVANYRNQWNTVTTPYSTANLSYDMRLGKSSKTVFSGIGLNISQDMSGSPQIKTFQVSLNYACHVKLGEKSRIGAGLYGGGFQKSISLQGIQWPNQYDGQVFNGSLPSKEIFAMSSIRTCLDAGGGINYEFNKNEKFMLGAEHLRISTGVSAFHINEPNIGIAGVSLLKMRYGGYINAEIGIPETNISVVPAIYYFKQGPSTELIAGSMFQYKLSGDSKYTGHVNGVSISLGGYYRTNDAAIVNALIKFSQYAIGFSYDLTISNLKPATRSQGAFEISLRFVNPNPFVYKTKR